MAEIQTEMLGDICLIRASGDITYGCIIDAVKNNYPSLKSHVIWDLENGSIDSISSHEFRMIPAIAKEHSINRFGSKTAYVSSNKSTYGLTRMYTAYAEMSQIDVAYNVFESVEEALHWLAASEQI